MLDKILRIKNGKLQVLINDPESNNTHWGELNSEDLLSTFYGQNIEYPEQICRMIQAYTILSGDVESGLTQLKSDLESIMQLPELKGHQTKQKREDNPVVDLGIQNTTGNGDGELVNVKLTDWIAGQKGLPTLIEGYLDGETDKAFKLIVDGEVLWLPKSQSVIVEG